MIGTIRTGSTVIVTAETVMEIVIGIVIAATTGTTAIGEIETIAAMIEIEIEIETATATMTAIEIMTSIVTGEATGIMADTATTVDITTVTGQSRARVINTV